MRHCRLLHIEWCNLMLPHNSTSRSSSSAGFSQTVLWIVDILFVSPRRQCWAHMWYLCHRLDLNSQFLLPRLRLIRSRPPMLAALPALLSKPSVSTTHVETHPVRPAGAKRSASTAHAGTHNSNGSCSRTDADLFPKPKAVILSYGQFWATQVLWT